MKKAKPIIVSVLCISLILQTACGNTGSSQNVSDNDNGSEAALTENIDEIRSGEEPQDSQDDTLLLHSDWMTSAGDFTKTWEKDYTSAEWEDGVCLTMYVHLARSDNDWIDIVEDELNHRLHLAGYDFYINFVHPDREETYDMSADEVVAQRQQNGMTIDMYVTRDYRTAVENGALLDLTDYLQSDGGSNLYAYHAPSVWQQLEMGDGNIYGIPMNPVATTRYVYAYNPQLADMLGIDMVAFDRDMAVLESEFPDMVEQGVIPIRLICREDPLMLSLCGMEKYGEIFAIRHTGDDWEAVDLFEEEEAVSFYEQLGTWRESGFLTYVLPTSVSMPEDGPPEIDRVRFHYRFMDWVEVDNISWFYDVNRAENGFVETAFYVPRGQVFVTENRNFDILVIDTNTDYPQECMQFLNLLTTDDEMRLLLYSGIENYHHVWENDVQIFDNYGSAFTGVDLGLAYDLRFWPAGHWGKKYATEIEEMNRDVSEGISLTVDCDFVGLEEQYEACCQLFEENILVFLGYYGAETGERLQALHDQLNEAGYQELIAAVNAMH